MYMIIFDPQVIWYQMGIKITLSNLVLIGTTWKAPTLHKILLTEFSTIVGLSAHLWCMRVSYFLTRWQVQANKDFQIADSKKRASASTWRTAAPGISKMLNSTFNRPTFQPHTLPAGRLCSPNRVSTHSSSSLQPAPSWDHLPPPLHPPPNWTMASTCQRVKI